MIGLWIIILILLLFMPLILMVCGAMFIKNPPEDINSALGYRTRRSMMNIDTWLFAHRYIGRLWLVIGIIMIPVTVIAMLPVLGGSEQAVMIRYGIITAVQVAAMLIPICFTETALKRNFDEFGRRR
ncbi:MAG: SdpI family protein [Clostridiales bacterium]|nr:SdpI family protein [Clostridiales bacterium]